MTTGASARPRAWSPARRPGAGALRRSLTDGRLGLDREPVEDEVRARQLARRGGQVGPLHDALGIEDDQRAVGHAAGLEVGAELARGLALGLEVRELRDARPDLRLEGLLRPDRVGGDPVEPRALGLEIAEDLLVDLELVGADRRERERIEDEDRGAALEVLVGEVVAVLVLEPELRRRGAGGDDRQRRRPSSLMRAR